MAYFLCSLLFFFVRSEINAEGHHSLNLRRRSPVHQMVEMHSFLVFLKHLWRSSRTADVSWASRVF